MNVLFEGRSKEEVQDMIVYCRIFGGVMARVKLLHKRLVKEKRIKK